MHQPIDKKNKIIIYLLLLLILSTTSEKFSENKNNYSSKVNQINIKGLSDANSSKIHNELNNLSYKNILLISKKEIQNITNKYNIIEEYTVTKIYPSTINITVKSTKFVARLSNKDLLVGANGKLIKDKENNDTLPYIFGEFNSKKFLKFKKNIEDSKFNFTDFKSISFYPSNRWDILTINGILIKLPDNNLLKSLNLSYKIIKNDQLKDSKFIDLRIANQAIIQ